MNILGLVFSILLILSFGFYASFDKHRMVKKMNDSFLGLSLASRKILQAYETDVYALIRSPTKNKKEKPQKTENSTKKDKIGKEKPRNLPQFNPPCARLNLWPLIQEGRDKHSLLYKQLLSLLKTFYGKTLFAQMSDQKILPSRFLSTWLKSVQQYAKLHPNDPIFLEKIELKEESMQRLYYKMLKGSKDNYPSILDYVKIDSHKQTKVCIFHAKPILYKVFFGGAAASVFDEMHGKNIVMTPEILEEACRKHYRSSFNPDLLTLIDLGECAEKNHEKILVQEDPKTHICIRKKIHPKPAMGR